MVFIDVGHNEPALVLLAYGVRHPPEESHAEFAVPPPGRTSFVGAATALDGLMTKGGVDRSETE